MLRGEIYIGFFGLDGKGFCGLLFGFIVLVELGLEGFLFSFFVIVFLFYRFVSVFGREVGYLRLS